MPCTNNHRTQRRASTLKVKPATLTVIAAILIVLSLFAVSTHVSAQSVNAISGRTTDINGSGIGDVTITFANTQTGQSATILTDASGNFSFDNSFAANTVTPSKTGYTFDPPNFQCVSTRGGGCSGSLPRDFIGATQTYTARGQVTDGNGNGISNVTLQLVSSNNLVMRTVFSDASGNYSFVNLPAGATYKVTFSKTGYSFNFSSLTITNLSANRLLSLITGTTRPYTISGQVRDANGNGASGVRVVLSRVGGTGPQFSITTDASGTYYYTNVAGEGTYTITPAKDGFNFNPSSQTFSNVYANQTANFTATPGPTLQFAAPQFDVAESDGLATITVTRIGDTLGALSVDYATSDGTAEQRSDYTTATGTLLFAPNESSKTFTVLITDDAYQEANETVLLTLSNATGGGLGLRTTAGIVIHDNDFGTPTANPIDDARFFVRQQYLDFLSRQPDAGGWDYWTNLINGTPGNNPAPCATNDAACLDNRRISVSAAFFIEQEFQDTGSFVYRFYKGTLSRRPNYAEFVPDRSRIVGGATLEASKQAFAEAWVRRAEFLQKYPQSLSATDFVNTLLATIKDTSGVDLSSQRQIYVDQLQAGGSRAQIIRSVVDTAAFQQAEYNRAFVLMQYFGYLKRDPDADGYNFWLDVLSNRVAGNYRAMVCAFITSAEYQDRFSSVRTRDDGRCSAAQ